MASPLSVMLLLVVLLVLVPVPVPATTGVCPGGLLSCPDPSTCCSTDSKKQPFICCPYTDAVCCADGRHCCRQGFTCDLAKDRCVRTAPKQGMCPDGRSECPVGATCCMLPDRSWGCCPFPNAVCCPDMLHCCPQGTRCDMENLTCLQEMQHPMLEIVGRQPAAIKGHAGLHA